ncbi:MAG: hypothetical protein MZU97_09015 [Bacillus subtilis]|nr:hypothetical protein [Bacillus subtilis]
MFLGGLASVAAVYLRKSKVSPDKMAFIALAGGTIGSIIGIVPGIIFSSSIQKTTSRIARFEARNTELKDSRNFVVYNPEQIEQAKKLQKKVDVKPDKEKNPLNPFSNIAEVFRNR